MRDEAAEERAQSECRRGGKLERAPAAFASSAMHDVSSNLCLQCCRWFSICLVSFFKRLQNARNQSVDRDESCLRCAIRESMGRRSEVAAERAQTERRWGGELKRLQNVRIRASTRKRVEAAEECVQSQRRRELELQLAAANFAFSVMHYVSSNLVFTMLWLVDFNLLCVIFQTGVMMEQQNGVMRGQQGSVVESGPVKPMSMESTTCLSLSFAVCDMRFPRICNQFVLIFCIYYTCTSLLWLYFFHWQDSLLVR